MKLKRVTMAALAALAMVLMLAGLTAGAQGMRIFLGESTTLTLPYQFSKLAVGDPSVADYLVQKNEASGAEILLNGKKAGSTNLIVWDAQGQQRDVYGLTVLVKDLKAFTQEIQQVVGRAPGLRFRVAGEKLIIEGEVATPQQRELLDKMVGDSPQVIKMVTLSPVALSIIADSIKQHLANNNVRVRPVGQKIVLEGVAYGQEQAARLESMARLYYPDVQSLLQVQPGELRPGAGDMIQVTANFMEVNNATIDGWGISWLPIASDGGNQITGTQAIGTGAGFTGSIVGTISSLFPKLSQAKEVGGAKVLETSSMSVRSGDPAAFQSGGEVAIPVSQSSGAVTISYKEYGVFLNVLPISDGDNVSLKLEVVVSSPTEAQPGGNFNFTKSRVATVQYCKSGDSVAVGGLITNRHTKLFDKLPTGASGALFQLYASEEFQKKRSQFVVFVTPAVLSQGAAEAHRDLKGLVEEKFDTYQENKR
ncbi:MAG: pilus assembly protein N-terminal domain-containing protein [Desulfarculus sp.]|nr:pilus assembly protein N-terminal domain-containing protein [Desulfarculus sp.]